MAITETLPPELEQKENNPAIMSDLGHAAVGEGPSDANELLRDIELGGRRYSTDLPEGVNPFDDGQQGDLKFQSLAPYKLDTLPEGHFEVSGVHKGLPGDGVSRDERIIDVHSGKNGKIISNESFAGKWKLVEGTGRLMKALGYELNPEGTHVTGIPTPETLVKAAAEAGVEVQLVADDDYIDGEVYLGAFSEGKYPASTRTESNYRHDIEDDHLTTLVMGGTTLKSALMEASSRALKGDRGTVDLAASNIDSYTATLRAVVSWHPDLLGEAYGKESGRRTLHMYGERLGIPPETTEAVLKATQEKATEFGLEVKELD